MATTSAVCATSFLQDVTQHLAQVRSNEGFLQTQVFLGTCKLVLPVVDHLGTAFALVKNDILGNIQRLADKAATDLGRYAKLFTIVQDEVVAGTAMGSYSCTKGLLWLKRAMEFMLAIIQETAKRPEVSLAQVVSETYTRTLMQYHGFLVSSAFTLAFKFVPNREYFVDSIANGSAEDPTKQMQDLVAAFGPVLQEVHDFLVENNLNDPVKV